jgi:hypothetical protein
MPLADRIELTNDSNSSGGGIHADEQAWTYAIQVSETSAANAATSAQIVPLFIAKANGRIYDAFIGVAQTAVSASGFVSALYNANVRINSATCLSTQPSIGIAAASAANNRSRSNNSNSSLGTTVSAVVNAASAYFSQGDMISFDYGVTSAGSAAAGQAFTGLYFGCNVHYSAN